MSLVALPQAAEPAAAELPVGLEALPPVMSPKVLGDVLEVSSKTLERWRDAGTGPAFLKLAGSSLIRYTRDDVVAWLLASRAEVNS